MRLSLHRRVVQTRGSQRVRDTSSRRLPTLKFPLRRPGCRQGNKAVVRAQPEGMKKILFILPDFDA